MQIQLSNIKRHRSNQQQRVHLAETQDEGTAESDATHLQACIDAFDDESDAPEAVVNACISGGTEEEWFLDSRASSHVTGNPHLLSDISHSRIPSIRTAGGISMPVAHQGTVSTIDFSGKIKHIDQVLYVPGVKTNLLSVGKLTDAGYRVLFSKHNCLIYDKDNPNCILLRAIRDSRNNLYRVQEQFKTTSFKSTEEPLINVTTITCTGRTSSQHSSRAPLSYEPVPAQENQPDSHLNPEPVSSEPTPINSTSRLSQTQVWHKRLGHLNYQSLYHLTTKQLVAGIPPLPLIKHVCPSCMIGKLPQDRKPKHRTTRTSKPLQLIHSDICGPMPVTSRTGNRYILTFIDDFTRKTWLYFLSEKSQTLDSFKQFKSLVETPSVRIETLRSDRGGEYLSQDFIDYCKLHGIARQLTAGYSPHQNGLAERKNKTLLEGIRSIVTGTRIPKYLWDEIARTVNYLQNRSPTKALKLLTPEEAFTGIKPHLAHLRIIGCTAYCHIPDEKRRKFDPKAIPSILIGYDKQSKAYRCYDPATRKIIVSRSVRFDEMTLAFPHSEITEPLIDNFIFPEPRPNSSSSCHKNPDPIPPTISQPEPIRAQPNPNTNLHLPEHNSPNHTSLLPPVSSQSSISHDLEPPVSPRSPSFTSLPPPRRS